MKIGVFGGSFNPPHKMHEQIANGLLKKHFVERIIFVPTGNRYPKQELIDGEKRLAMLNIICSKNAKLLVSDFELQKELTYTYQTLEYLQKEYPNDQIYFILGADNLAQLMTWKNHKDLLEHYHYLVVDRYHQQEKLEAMYQDYKDRIMFVSVKEKAISSTQIRDWIKQKQFGKVKKELDSDVFDYIVREELYH